VQVIAGRTVCEMTYNVSSGTLNLTHSLARVCWCDEIVDILRSEQESNRQLRDYVERITLRILEKNPSILEIASRQK